eukprot:g5565.t1
MTLRDHAFKLDIRRVDIPQAEGGDPVPQDLDDLHGLLVLGGAQSVDQNHVWMRQEHELIRRAHDAGLPVVGICLGAQLIAQALGGKVEKMDSPEVGFKKVRVLQPAQTETMLAGVPWESMQYLSHQWQITELPAGAQLLASSDACRTQCFRAGHRTFAFQFHFELDRPGIELLASEESTLLSAAGVTTADIAAQCDEHYDRFAEIGNRLSLNLASFAFPFSELLFDRTLARGEQGEARSQITRMLRLDEDRASVRAFHRVDPRWRRSGRARLFRSPTLFEDVIKTVTSCNVAWPSTVNMNKRLCQTLGARCENAHAFPTAQKMARTRPGTLRGRCRVGYRDQRMVDLAKLFVRGEIDEMWLSDPATDDEDVFQFLVTLPGIGPYAASNIMQLLGRYSRIALDTESVRHGKTVLGMTGTDAQIMKKVAAHFEPFGEHKFKSYWFELRGPIRMVDLMRINHTETAMNHARNALLTLTLAGAALGTIGMSSPPLRCGTPVPVRTDSALPGVALYDRFGVHEWEGLVCQLNNVSLSVNYSSSSWGAPGARLNRNLNISGMLADHTGKRIFRLKGAPRLLELTDLSGRDLTSDAQVHINPQSRQVRPFTRANSSSTNQNFNVSVSSFSPGIDGIGRVAMEVDVEMAADLGRHDFAPKATGELVEVAPNFSAGLTRYRVTGDGALHATLDYRIPDGDGPNPVFHGLEVIDINGDEIASTMNSKEIVTSEATQGLVFFSGNQIGAAEVAGLRVTFLTDVVTHTFTLEEGDLPLLGE